MSLRFPSLDALKLAITSGTVPDAIVAAPLKAGVDDSGSVWIQPSGKIDRTVQAGLRRLGAKSPWTSGSAPMEAFLCWPHVFPLVEDPDATALTDRTPVLFELAQPEQLPQIVLEILRLGNDRQGYRHVSCAGQDRAMLRVIGPPYYSLLRALDPQGAGRTGKGEEAVVFAFVESRPRVWVQLGYRHPLVDRIVPPAGQIVLLRAPRCWDFVEEGGYQDVYRTFDYQLPCAPAEWTPTDLAQRFTVPLRLTQGGDESAELWVLRDDAEKQLDELVGSSDDHFLSRLAFAVGERDGGRTVVVRLRPSKSPPPVVVFQGIGFHSHLKLPNLFVPCGSRLHPPLRRAAVAQLLASDISRVTWLYPEGDGRFTPESLPESSFRPLSDWIDYVLDREPAAMGAWIDAHQFDFEPFVCRDDPRPKERTERPKETPQPQSRPAPVRPATAESESESATPELPAEVETLPAAGTTIPTERDAVQKRLAELELRLRASDLPLDSPDRAAIWLEMGHVNAWLAYDQDAAICWSNAVWEHDPLPAASRDAWLESTRRAGGTMDAGHLDRMISQREVQPEQATCLANYLICAARTDSPPAALLQRLGRMARYLEHQESQVPVRTAWLAWCAIHRLSGGDVLALARARDRTLERLFQFGLRPDLDLPSFLRTIGAADSQQARILRDRIGPLHKLVAGWIQEPAAQPNPRTREYAGLMFAYAMARLGMTGDCQTLVQQSRDVLECANAVHDWAWQAFHLRIRQALDGRAGHERLAQELFDRLEGMDRMDRYKIDRLRQHSRILEPCEQIDPYRNWRRHANDFVRQVTSLPDATDHAELEARITALFAQLAPGPDLADREAMLLAAALELAPRLGEEFACGLLDRVQPLLDRGPEVAAGLRVLEKALFLAAHFDQSEHLSAFLSRIHGLLESEQLDQAADALERLLSECFCGLRKLGMRDEIGRLLARIAARVGGPREPSSDVASAELASLRLLLLAASGWLFFGQNREAVPVLNQVRARLADEKLKAAERTDLVRAYLTALGFAPAEFALPRIEELFPGGQPVSPGAAATLPKITDSLTTTSHFALYQLKVTEAIVLALVSEEFAMDSEGRRWLDEDEFLVRRRIHRDVRSTAGP